jgi:hypothetical protein
VLPTPETAHPRGRACRGPEAHDAAPCDRVCIVLLVAPDGFVGLNGFPLTCVRTVRTHADD